MTAWTPSLARTVCVAAPRPLRALTVGGRPLFWPPKAPAAHLDYSVDLTAWLADGDDTIATADASIAPSASPYDLGCLWVAPIGSGVTLFLTGGQSATRYAVSVLVTTAAGRVALFEVALTTTSATAVAPVAGAAPPPNVLTDGSGSGLFLSASTPLLLA